MLFLTLTHAALSGGLRTSRGLFPFFGSWVSFRVRDNHQTLRARLCEISSRVWGLLCVYCIVYTQLFFMIWVHWNILSNFSGCSCPILNLLYNYICLFISFPTTYSKLSYCKNSRSKRNAKSWKRWIGFSSWLGFAQTYFAISRAAVFWFFWFFRKIIKFVFSLAFQHHIPNCYTAKSCKATAKECEKSKTMARGGMMQGAEWEALEPVSNPYGRRPRETTCFCIPLLQAASFKNQELVLTFLTLLSPGSCTPFLGILL